MERTKYTPKRLLSLLLALIMLLGMFPTATLAAGTGDEPVVTPYVKTFEGLTFEFTLDVPERPFFRYGEKRVDVHYTITKSNDNNMVSELTEFKNGEVAPVNVTAKASDEKYSAVTHKDLIRVQCLHLAILLIFKAPQTEMWMRMENLSLYSVLSSSLLGMIRMVCSTPLLIIRQAVPWM